MAGAKGAIVEAKGVATGANCVVVEIGGAMTCATIGGAVVEGATIEEAAMAWEQEGTTAELVVTTKGTVDLGGQEDSGVVMALIEKKIQGIK